MDNHKNEPRSERESHDSFYLRQNELAQKSITLQVLHDHLNANKALCEERKIVLAKEMKALDEIHSKVWNLQNRICNKVWDFSMKHDTNVIICNYPDLTSDSYVFCECDPKTDVLTCEDNIEIEKLILEIRNLESNLNTTNCDSLKKELILAEKELQTCEKNDPENESLKKEITACEERISSLRIELGIEYKKIEGSESMKNNTVFKINSMYSTRKQTPVNAPPLSAPRMNLDASKNTCNNNSVPDRGGFVTANTYLNTTKNPVTLSNTSASCKRTANETIPNEKLPSIINPSKKKFVFKTKSNITQRR